MIASRRLIIILALLLSGFVGALIGAQSPYATAQAPTPAPDHLTAAPISGAGTRPAIWLPAPFCVAVWWQDARGGVLTLCAEHKGDELHTGAGWKLDLPTPAWLALVGKRPDGAWLLSAVAKDNEQWPAPGYVAVDGPTLVQVIVNDTPTPSPLPPPPTATVGMGPTATPSPSPTVASGATSTPSAPTLTPTRTATPAPMTTPTVLFGNMCRPDPTPVYPHSITIYGQGGLNAPAMFWYCVANPNVKPDLIFIVPEATFRAAYDDGPRQLLIDLGR